MTPDGSIGVMNSFFFDPGDFGPGGRHRPDPDVKIRRSRRFEPIILCSFLSRFRKTKLENHSSKQMMVYEQITFFMKNRIFTKNVFDQKIDFLIDKSIFRLKKAQKNLEKPGGGDI